MGHIAALLSKNGENVSPILVRMLEATSTGRGDANGIASSDGIMIKRSPKHLQGLDSNVSLGHKLHKIMPHDQPQPLGQYGYAMVFEGRRWHDGDPLNLTIVSDTVGDEPAPGMRGLIKESQGSFAMAILEGGRIICGRDAVGVVPLYYGENSNLTGVASNRKMLWTAGLVPKTLPPGHIAEITELGISLKPVRSLPQPPIMKIAMEDAIVRLDRLLAEAVETRCKGIFRAALGFSGGIDSSLLAHYLDKTGVDVDLICVGMEGSTEFEAAEQAAESLGLPIRLESYSIQDVEEDLDDVLWSVEEPDPMKVGVALPIHWSAKSATGSGHRVFFSGNGSDELFGGYHKYVREYAESGETVRETMYGDVVASHEVNYERDHKICSDAGLELRLPFADLRVVEFGLSLPLELKLPKDPASPRKLILRALAEKLGFPEEIVNRRKRAVQYSTGVNKALRQLARKRGKTLRRYLADRFEEVKAERLGNPDQP